VVPSQKTGMQISTLVVTTAATRTLNPPQKKEIPKKGFPSTPSSRHQSSSPKIKEEHAT